MTEKTCTVCKETKPLSEFGTDRHRKDGKNPVCKSCISSYYKRRRAELKAGATYRPRVRRKAVKQDEPTC